MSNSRDQRESLPVDTVFCCFFCRVVGQIIIEVFFCFKSGHRTWRKKSTGWPSCQTLIFTQLHQPNSCPEDIVSLIKSASYVPRHCAVICSTCGFPMTSNQTLFFGQSHTCPCLPVATRHLTRKMSASMGTFLRMYVQ